MTTTKSNATKIKFEDHGYIEISTGPAGLVVHFSPDCPPGVLLFEKRGLPGSGYRSDVIFDTEKLLNDYRKNKPFSQNENIKLNESEESYFPLLVRYEDSGEAQVVNHPDDLRAGISFNVLRTNYLLS